MFNSYAVTHMTTARQWIGKHVPEVTLSTTEYTTIVGQRLPTAQLSRHASAKTDSCYGINTR
jgi:phage protein U